MIGVLFKGNWHQGFNSLIEAEKYVHDKIENQGYKEEDWSYMFY